MLRHHQPSNLTVIFPNFRFTPAPGADDAALGDDWAMGACGGPAGGAAVVAGAGGA